MLKNRLVAVLILRNGQVVQSLNFKHTNVIHSQARMAVDCFDRWSVDEIVVLDVSPTTDGRALFYKAIEDIAKKCFVPMTVGGWVTSPEEARKLLLMGADKIAINTAAYENPELVSECAKQFGSQCIVASIDVRKNEADDHIVYVDRGKKDTEVEVVDWAKQVIKNGAGEIFLTSIDHDGARKGFDLELMEKVAGSVSVPVIAFGGVQEWQHLVDGIVEAKVDAVSAANIFHYTEHSTKIAKEYMRSKGVNVR